MRFHIKRKGTYPASSPCNLDNGFALLPPLIGVGVEAETTPPPPLSGFAMRPKLSVEDVAVF
jgi:hypothetical protein